ncbi:hypothetical protein HOH45_09240 [bacterium]|nr:hypothetical protein [bacterium]
MLKNVRERPLISLLILSLFLSSCSLFSIFSSFFAGFDFRFFPLDLIDGRLHISSYFQVGLFFFFSPGFNFSESNRIRTMFHLFRSKRFFYWIFGGISTFYTVAFYLRYRYDLVDYSVLSKYLNYFWKLTDVQGGGLRQLILDGPWVPVLWPLFKMVSYIKNPLFYYFISIGLFLSSFVVLYWLFLRFVFKRSDYSLLVVVSLLFLPATQLIIFYGFHPSMICFFWLVLAIYCFLASYRFVAIIFSLLAMLTWNDSVFFVFFLMSVLFLSKVFSRFKLGARLLVVRKTDFVIDLILDSVFLVFIGFSSIILFLLNGSRGSFFQGPGLWVVNMFISFSAYVMNYFEQALFNFKKLMHLPPDYRYSFVLLLVITWLVFFWFFVKSTYGRKKLLIFLVSVSFLLGIGYGPFYNGQVSLDKARSENLNEIFSKLDEDSHVIAPQHFFTKHPYFESYLDLNIFHRKGIPFSMKEVNWLSYRYEFMLIPLKNDYDLYHKRVNENLSGWDVSVQYSAYILYQSKHYFSLISEKEGG